MDSKLISIRIPVSVLEIVDRVAANDRRSRNQVIVMKLEELAKKPEMVYSEPAKELTYERDEYSQG